MSYLCDDLIRLRALEPEDLELLYRWENDSALWEVGSTLAPFSRYVLREYIAGSDRSIYETRQLRLMIELRERGEVIGIVDLFDLDPHANRAACGILLDVAFQGKGLAHRAMSLLMDYAFGRLALHQLYVHIPVRNLQSLRLFERCGFKKAGHLQDWIRTERGFEDALLFQKVKE